MIFKKSIVLYLERTPQGTASNDVVQTNGLVFFSIKIYIEGGGLI